jgi:hypothetical protein
MHISRRVQIGEVLFSIHALCTTAADTCADGKELLGFKWQPSSAGHSDSLRVDQNDISGFASPRVW